VPAKYDIFSLDLNRIIVVCLYNWFKGLEESPINVNVLCPHKVHCRKIHRGHNNCENKLCDNLNHRFLICRNSMGIIKPAWEPIRALRVKAEGIRSLTRCVVVQRLTED
jgi:hypothetical protein